MRKGTKVLLVVGCLAAAIALTLYLGHDEEPYCQGRPLTDWLEIHFSCRGETNAITKAETEQAAEAIRHIGTNALPFLLHWISYEPNKWQVQLNHFTQRLPVGGGSPLRSWHSSIRNHFRARLAADGFSALGPWAAPAIPELVRVMHNASSFDTQELAATALAGIGKDALPSLLQTLINTNSPARAFVADSIGDMGTNALSAVPILAQYTTDNDRHVAEATIRTLGTLALAPESAIPALTNALVLPEVWLRVDAIRSIHRFGSKASVAVPSLLAVFAEDSDGRVCSEAFLTLRAIAPEVLTNAPAQ